MMTNTKPLGQRLREWRRAKSWSLADAAAELSLSSDEVYVIEQGYLLDVHPSIQQRIENLIGPPPEPLTADEQALVQRVVEARRAGLIVTLIRPATTEYGQVAVTFGDDEWRKWI